MLRSRRKERVEWIRDERGKKKKRGRKRRMGEGGGRTGLTKSSRR
jgi:hypothetical protein